MKTFLKIFLLSNVIFLGTLYLTFCYLELEWMNMFVDNEKIDRELVVFLVVCSIGISSCLAFVVAEDYN